MDALLDTLSDLRSQLGEAVHGALSDGVLPAASVDHVLSLMSVAAEMSRLTDALLVEAVGSIAEHDSGVSHADRVTTRLGCRDLRELVCRATRVSGRRAGEIIAAAAAVQQPVSISTGEALPPQFPALRAALADGVVGVDAVSAISAVLGRALPATAPRLEADAELAASASGSGVDGAPPPHADELRLQAQVWAMYLDPDGAAPRESVASRRRSLSWGIARDGIVPLRGALEVEVAAQLQRLTDAIDNPRTRVPEFADADATAAATGGADSAEPSLDPVVEHRTPAQRRHDALAIILAAAAGSADVPALGGAAPTLVVSVTASDLRNGTGFAHVDGMDEPISIAAARHVACIGAVQRVVHDENGRIRSIVTLDRVFNAWQRRAIALRDGGCIIPGCGVPAAWCEVHHVAEAFRGGPTATDNGVLLCWHHHRTIDTSGWEIRMMEGVPHVRGPSWWDGGRRWRPATTSPIMHRRRHAERTAG